MISSTSFHQNILVLPLLQMTVIRPDGIKLELLSTSLPFSNSKTIHSERIFSTDGAIKKNLSLQSELFAFTLIDYQLKTLFFQKHKQMNL